MADFDDKVKAFLEQHPQVRVGSEAWDAANKDIDLGDTFTAISKPLPNMVVLQTVDAATDRALVVAAFVNDAKAEAHFHEVRATDAMVTTIHANPAQLPLDQQLAQLRTILCTNKTLVTVLERVATLGLPNWYLAAGAVSQTVWNHVSGLTPDTGISDYDVVYHDGGDLSWDAEDAYIQKAKALFADMPHVEVEIRNQARVHLWFESKYGGKCAPHASVEAGIDSWISTSAMIGIRLEEHGHGWSVYAPRGLSDYFNMVARPNTALGSKEHYDKKAARWKGIWDKLTVEPWPSD